MTIPLDKKDEKDDCHSINTDFSSVSTVMAHVMQQRRSSEVFDDSHPHIHQPGTHHPHLRHATVDGSRSMSLLDNASIGDPWMKKKKATKFFVNMITCLYALILVIFACIIELSPTWQNDLWLGETIFFLCMYFLGILFIAFLYCLLIYPHPVNFCIRVLAKYGIIQFPERYHLEPVSHTGEGAGTLYLRLGALFFGCAGIMLFGLEIFLCFQTHSCKSPIIAKHITGLLFTFLQMHFLFCNTKISIVRFKSFCKLGFMHLVTINLWTWFRFVLVKQMYKVNKKLKKKLLETTPSYESSSSSSSEETDLIKISHGYLSEVVNDTMEAVLEKSVDLLNTTTPCPESMKKMISIESFGDLATFLTTCIVEYSVIGAAVMFIIWSSIDHPAHGHGHSQVKRKHRMGIDCSHSSVGLFAGIMFFIASLISMGVYSMFEQLKDVTGTSLVFGIVDICLFSVALFACFIGFWQMRKLQYRLHAHGEVIDEILLIIGLTGELIYCTIGIDLFINNRRHTSDERSLLPIFVFITRLLQVAVQTAFILTVSRLRCLSAYAVKYKPGKQVITFLLVCNLTLFAFHTFEAMKQTYGITDNANPTYLTICYAVMPLLVFYRFHSSACLAEIWKHTYSMKESHHTSTTESIPGGTTVISIEESNFSSSSSSTSDSERAQSSDDEGFQS